MTTIAPENVPQEMNKTARRIKQRDTRSNAPATVRLLSASTVEKSMSMPQMDVSHSQKIKANVLIGGKTQRLAKLTIPTARVSL